MKATADILFIKTCKIENSIQTSAKVKLSVKDDNKKPHSKNNTNCYGK